MAKPKYEMKTERSKNMDTNQMQKLSDMRLAPYMQLATGLIGKERHAGGNMFRHQMDTFAILLDYGYIDPVLLKASIIHDTIEDIPGFIPDLITNADEDGPAVLDLVREVTRKEEENKKQFLIPRGFAHGFLVLSETAEFCYKCDDFYHPNDEGGLAWNDPEIGIDWASQGVKGEYDGTANASGYALADGTPLNLSDKDQMWAGIKDTFRF